MTFTVSYRPRSMRSLAIAEGDRVIFSARSSSEAIERLQVDRGDYHTPVMEEEVVASFASHNQGVVVDATLGGGGHARALLERYPRLRVLGIDRDPEARARASETLAAFPGRFVIVAATFSDVASVVAGQRAWIGTDEIVGVLMDLGVSSHQLDAPERGFSFRADAPLDMRMDPTSGVTAAQFIAEADIHDFTRLLRANGEDRFAGAIARAVLASAPTTTAELSAAVERAVPMAARRKGHVATRVFQALRIAVNEEVTQLESGLDGALEVLVPGGVLVVISYHSGEDRVVKRTFNEWASGGCHCSHELGCVCGAVPRVAVERASALLASASEINKNPRARSARFRTARKVGA
jgi:16S rRNA (cytosine1402-N4)-methyltransferase